MHIIQILLPLRDNAKKPFPLRLFSDVKTELIEKFNGLTAFLQAPAQGLWVDDKDVQKDEIVILEVMCNKLEKAWWSSYRASLEKRFQQEMIVIRSYPAQLL